MKYNKMVVFILVTIIVTSCSKSNTFFEYMQEKDYKNAMDIYVVCDNNKTINEYRDRLIEEVEFFDSNLGVYEDTPELYQKLYEFITAVDKAEIKDKTFSRESDIYRVLHNHAVIHEKRIEQMKILEGMRDSELLDILENYN